MIYADVENIGVLEFPDGTSQAVIQRTVKQLVSEKNNDQKGFMDKYLPSVKRTGEIYKQEVSEGSEAMRTALEKPTGRSIAGGFLGALQYGFSPLTAIAKGLVGEPVEQNLERVGVPKKAAKFVGEMAETSAYFVPYGKAVQTAIVGQRTLKEAQMAKKVFSEMGGKSGRSMKTTSKSLEFPEGLSPEAISDATKPISKAGRKSLKTSVVDDVVEKLKQPMAEKWEPSERRITQEIVNYITENPKEIEKVASKYNLSPDQLAAQMKDTMTLAGTNLGRMGKLAKEIKAKFKTPYMRRLSESIESELPEITAMDKFGTGFKSVENIRRAALVSQFATTMRNIVSQGARVTLGSIDDAFQGSMNAFLKSGGQGTFSSVKSTLKGLGEGLDLFTATVNRLRPSQRAKLLEILDTGNAISAKAKMFTTPVQDVMLTNKLSKVLNYFNTTQEYFFRNIAFEAKLKQLSRKAGIDFKNLKAVDFPEEMLTQAAKYSLEMTFAAMPKSKFGKEWVKAMSHPIMTALSNPFPRFMYGNAFPFLKNFSPLGFLEAASPKVVAGIVSGHPEKFTNAITKATLGTIMLNTAFHIRNSEYGGEKWYEVKIGNKRIDTRAFAPFSTYLFAAEAMQAPERIRPGDFGSALLSLNRIGGTGLVLSDILRGKDAATVVDPLKRLAGAWMGGFSVPLKTPKDLYTAIDPEEAYIRDIKDDEFWGPTKQNIPEYSQRMPKAVSPLKKGSLKSETPILRQFTGLSYRTKNKLQQEVDTLQIPYSRIYPRTGSGFGDRQVNKIMSEILDKAYPALEATNYKQLDSLTRKIILTQLFRDAKAEARNVLMQTNPQLALRIKLDNIPKDIQEFLATKGIPVN